jgi:hypothetical protein
LVSPDTVDDISLSTASYSNFRTIARILPRQNRSSRKKKEIGRQKRVEKR